MNVTLLLVGTWDPLMNWWCTSQNVWSPPPLGHVRKEDLRGFHLVVSSPCRWESLKPCLITHTLVISWSDTIFKFTLIKSSLAIGFNSKKSMSKMPLNFKLLNQGLDLLRWFDEADFLDDLIHENTFSSAHLPIIKIHLSGRHKMIWYAC